jgi:hypothetical protein
VDWAFTYENPEINIPSVKMIVSILILCSFIIDYLLFDE